MKKYILTILFISFSVYARTQDFITTWDLSVAGSGPTQIMFGVGTSGICNYNWETIPAGATGSGTFAGNTLTITGLPANAMIRLKINTNNFNRININNGIDGNRLKDVEQWGAVTWINMQHAFYGCSNLNCTATDIPDLSLVADMSHMFDSCLVLNGPANIGSWNTISITNMTCMFRNNSLFNQPIDTWNTSNVTNMSYMFESAAAFNQPLGNWNTMSVTNMYCMFFQAAAFNQPVGNWNTINVTDMSYLFCNAAAFNQPIGNWNTGNVAYMPGMFLQAIHFNQPIGNWNTSNVTNMFGMFLQAAAFDQAINTWNTGNVVNMASMFDGAIAFNQPIWLWNTGNVTTMQSMFAGAVLFNQALAWNTSNVTTMNGMFDGAIAFNQPIGSWNTASVTDMAYMFNGAAAFNQPIGNWNTGNVLDMTDMFSLATAFDQPIGNWNTTNVIYMSAMFNGATSFNQPIGNWNTANVLMMDAMFSFGSIFNQPIGNWNTSNVEQMFAMFMYSTAFNQSIGNWNTANVKNMTNMFAYSSVFNQPIGNWNTSHVQTMHAMFRNATAFNQAIGNWQVDSCAHMMFMFEGATSFNQAIGNWQLNPNVNMANMLDNSGMDCNHYSSTLSGWANNLNIPLNRNLGAINLEYNLTAQGARNFMINSKGWTIFGDSLDINCCVTQTFTLNDTACFSYSFNGLTLTNSGTYYDTLINANGCDSIVTLNLVINGPDIGVSQTAAVLTANANAAIYQWLNCEPFQVITGATFQNFTAISNGSYAVIITQNGCTDTSACYPVTGIGLNNYDLSNYIKIFPNPVTEFLQIESELPLQNASIKVLSITGLTIAEYSDISTNKFSIDMSSYSSGTYLIQITGSGYNYVKRIYKGNQYD